MAQQDVNKIIDTLNSEWAGDLAQAKRKIAVLAEENRLVKAELESVKSELDELKQKEGAE